MINGILNRPHYNFNCTWRSETLCSSNSFITKMEIKFWCWIKVFGNWSKIMCFSACSSCISSFFNCNTLYSIVNIISSSKFL